MTDDLQNAAINDLLKLNPKILDGAKAHMARVVPVEVPAPQMTPQEVQAEIDRICGRAQKSQTPEPNPVEQRDGEMARMQGEYAVAVAKRQHEADVIRAKEIMRQIQPEPEKP